MEKKNAGVFAAAVSLCSDIVMLATLYWIFSYTEFDHVVDPGLPYWLAFALAEFAAIRLFLRKERQLNHAAALCAGIFVLQCVVTLLLIPKLPTLMSTLFALLFWGVTAAFAFLRAKDGIPQDRITLRFEGLILLGVAFLLIVQITGISPDYILTYLPAIVLCLAALLTSRTAGSQHNEGGAWRGAVIIAGLVILMTALIGVFLLFVSAPVGDIAAAVVGGLWAALRWLGGMLTRFMGWLLSLLPAPEAVPMEGEAIEGASGMNAEMEMPVLENMPLFMLIGIIAFAVSGVVVWFLVHRGKKTRVSRVSTVSLRRSKAKKRAHGTFLVRISFFLKYITHRSTPEGWLIRCERWAAARRKGRGKGETPRAFLTRLSPADGEAAAALAALANTLDARFYGAGSAGLDKTHAAALRKLLR